MPTIITHAVAAYTGGKALKLPVSVIITGMFCSMLPDADVISFHLGIPYDSLWGHRGITHSVFFSLLAATAGWFLLRGKGSAKWIFIYLFSATLSHPVLDACTNGGRGVAFLAPFSNERFFFPFRPIMVSPLSMDSFMNGYGLKVILSEVKWVWLPCLVVLVFLRLKPVNR